jgi:hypothetical protein
MMIIADGMERSGDEVHGILWQFKYPVPRRTGNLHNALIFMN